MLPWSTLPSICTCPSVISRLLPTRSIKFRSVVTAPHPINPRTVGRDTATLGGGRCHPLIRKPVLETLSRVLDLGSSQGALRHPTLPDGCSGRASGSMRPLRLSGHLLQLLPESPLSQVPDQCPGEMAARATARTSTGRLLPPRL